jgi:hypothetical protein
MVDSRIYRSGLALVAVAVIVFGFSLTSQPAAAPSSLAPVSLNGRSLYSAMQTMAKQFPHRSPGSPGDRGLAGYVAGQLRSTHGFTVATAIAQLQTSAGEQPVETVSAVRTGLSSGTIVVVSHRDAASSPATADLSGTAVMLDLARQLSGQTESHTVMLVSTSGSVGAAGATQLARSLAGQPVDAVITLGDLGAPHPTQPLVDPWSDAAVVTPALLRQTISKYVATGIGLPAGNSNLGAQFAHLAFPFTITEQGPFGSYGQPAVGFSLSGYAPTPAGQQVDLLRLQQSEDVVLQTLNALDNGPAVPGPSAYLVLSGQIVPSWAVRLLVLALILPVAVATIDAVARTRRRGHSLLRWLGWVLASAVPFVLVLIVLLIVKLAGFVSRAPPGPVAGGVPIGAGGTVLIVILAALLVAAFVLLRPRCVRLAARLRPVRRQPETPSGDAAGVALMVVLAAVTLVIWLGNPFAAALLVPALHLWLWLAQPGVRGRRWLMVALGLIGLVPALLILAYYVHGYHFTPIGFLWSTVLLVLGGQLSPLSAFGICLLLGCPVSVLVIVLRAAPAPPQQPTRVSVRGPVTYAGPGSLGGTESALGSRR